MIYNRVKVCASNHLNTCIPTKQFALQVFVRLHSTLEKDLQVANVPYEEKPDLKPVLEKLFSSTQLEERKKNINQFPTFMKKLQSVIKKNEEHKHLLLGNVKKLKLSKTYISNQLVESLMRNKELFEKDEIEIASFLEYLTYKNLKMIESHFLEKYKNSEQAVPLCLYNALFRNYRQILQNKDVTIIPTDLLQDIRELFEFKQLELKQKHNGNLPVLNENEELLVEEMHSDLLQQIVLSLKYKNIKSSITNKQMLKQLPTTKYGSPVSLKEINKLLSLFISSFGVVENRVSQTQMIQILGHFDNFDKQMEIFQHMKFLSVKKNSPDKHTYLNMLISKLKQKDLLGGMDLIDEYKQNMKIYYEKLYQNKLSVNQRGKQQIPLLPIYFSDSEFFEKLDKLYKRLEAKHQLDDEQCDAYYIGVPLELRITFIRLIIAVCSNFKVDKASGLTPESIMGYRFKAWDLLYGILLELPENESNNFSRTNVKESLISGLLESGTGTKNLINAESDLKIKAKPFLDSISMINLNDPVIENVLNSINAGSVSVNEKSSQVKKDFIKVCMEMSLFEKDVELARCTYIKFFNEFILPKLNGQMLHQGQKNYKSKPLNFNKIFSFRERELWMQVYHTFLKTYYNNNFLAFNEDNAKSSVKKIMSLVNEQGKNESQSSSQSKLKSLKIYQVNPKTNWIRSKIMEGVGIEAGEFKQLDLSSVCDIKIPFFPTLNINEEPELKLMESKAVHDWHYYNLWNNFENLNVSKRLDNETIDNQSINVPSLFIAELKAILDSGDKKLLKFNIRTLLSKWFVLNCEKGKINSLLTQEGVLLSYISTPMKYGKNFKEFVKRLDKHFINVIQLDNIIGQLQLETSDSLVESLYLETFKAWKSEPTFIAQLEYSDVNGDVNFMKRTWNERLANKNYSAVIRSGLKQSYTVELTENDKHFYKKYVKTQFENDLILESYEFVKATCKYIEYEYKDLKTMIDVLKELEDFNKVDYLKKLINKTTKNNVLKSL